jgi:hypothetical protein
MSNNQQRINACLTEVGQAIDKSLSLNDQGICALAYESLTIVIEAPEFVDLFFLYTTLCHTGQLRHPLRTLTRCLALNHLQHETAGGCLSIDPMSDELVFCYSGETEGIHAQRLSDILNRFMLTAVNLSETIAATDDAA